MKIAGTSVLVSTILVVMEIQVALSKNCRFQKRLDSCRKAYWRVEKYCSAVEKCIDHPKTKSAILRFEKFVHTTHPGLFGSKGSSEIELKEMYGHEGHMVDYPSTDFPKPPDRRAGETVKGALNLTAYKPAGSVWNPYPKWDYECKRPPSNDRQLPVIDKRDVKDPDDGLDCLPPEPCHTKTVSFFTLLEDEFTFDNETWTPVHLPSLDLYQYVHTTMCSGDNSCRADANGACKEAYKYVYIFMRRTDYTEMSFKKVPIPSCCECRNIGEDDEDG
ncbi:unnamed protein product [Owenia fusiformis]|uniref:Uncharacterized protein n=1 Tax=Owenia fusiformis TaxID=6347 RepID=A0A8J1UP11_OWEFU|nr:unnamed protein product [Owenia fusiformis]